MHKLPLLPPGVPTLTSEEARRLDDVYPGIPNPSNCITCKGTKTFKWWGMVDEPEETPALRNFDEDFSPDTILATVARRAPVDYECRCVDQWVAHRYFLHCGIGLWYQRLCWEDAGAVPESAATATRDFTSQAEWNISNGVGMILRGTIGSGKSLLATLTLKELLGRGYSGYFTTFETLLDTFAASWRQPEEKRWFERMCKNVDVLVIDDIGRENKAREKVDGEIVKGHTNAVAERAIDNVLRHRLANACSTIITTNFTEAELQMSYGSNVLSLFGERSSIVPVESSVDYRGERVRARLDEERDLGLTRPVTIG